ncbi:hypothetical protein [Ruminococcus sp.]|uniref:hypothetical protein n=1 Tax=Ruminococcus sp. TaxID=41978 RepID=UPI0025D8CB0B|nr:hypothetical protein [Ruminococcus sp.]
MRHFCEPGVTEYAEKTDTYAAISIQDTYGGGFGFELKKNKYCKDVLTLYFDDIEEPEHGLRLISFPQAIAIVKFIKAHSEDVDTLLIHCFAGVSRSRAVGAFAREVLDIPPTDETDYNEYVYAILHRVWKELNK